MNKQLYKGSLQTIILKLLEENQSMYGYEITQKVKNVTQNELVITEGALYPTLHKLETEGFLKVEHKNVGNRVRKYYELTEKGKVEMVNKVAELQKFLETIALIFTSGLKPSRT